MQGDRVAKVKKLSWVFFLLYAALMFWEVFIGPYRCHPIERRYNLYPMKTVLNYFLHSNFFNFEILVVNLVGNVATFLPLGFFLPLLFKGVNRFWKLLLWTLVLITGVETVQFVFNVGIFDIDDIILNTIGSLIGYGCYRMLPAIIGRENWKML